MKTQIRIAHITCIIIILGIFTQSCGAYKTPVLANWEEVVQQEIKHAKDCPVLCKERSTFFEEHVYDAEATCCAYCGQKQGVQVAALK